CHSRDHLEGDSGVAESADFLGDAPENQGIASLQPNHCSTRGGVSDQEGVDFVLSNGFFATAFADVAKEGRGWGHRQDLGCHKGIVEDDLCLGEYLPSFPSEQLRVAGASAEEIDFASHELPASLSGARSAPERPVLAILSPSRVTWPTW